MSAQHSYAEIEASLSAIVTPGTVFEIRCLSDRRGRIDTGYFDSPSAAATALSYIDVPYKGVYFTPNPVLPDLLARSYNRISQWAQFTTMDSDIVSRKWLLVDVDPKRPTNISSTDDEHVAAINKADAIAFMLAFEYGFPMPMSNSSGNGAHAMYPIDWPNTEEVRDEIAKFLKCLAARFDDQGTTVDTSVFNASRIWRLPGTWARKGDNVLNRPHRRACIIRPNVPGGSTLSFEQLQAFVRNNEYLLRRDGVSTGVANSVRSTSAAEYPAEERKYKTLNDHAMRRIPEWVPHFFPAARSYKEGYRIGSDELGRDLEEDLTIHPWPLGIKDFGVSDQGDVTEGRRTPISLLAEFLYQGDKDLAARKLADQLKAPLSEFSALPQPTPAISGVDALTVRPRYDFGSTIRNVAELQKREFAPVKWIVPNVLPAGHMMLAARPKMRKTWLALQLSMAIATGSKFLDWQCNKGDVLFLALEDNEKRIRSRIRTLQTFEMDPPDLSNLRYWTGGMSINAAGQMYVSNPEEQARTYEAFPRGEEGVEALDQYLDQFPETSFIVIDTLQHFKAPSNNRDIYARDYEAQMPITRLANRRGVCVLSVTHEKKGLANAESGDFMEDVTGSAGMTGGCDGVASIKGRRGAQEENESRKLLISGRDIPYDYEVDMSFDAERGGWHLAARSDVKVMIRTLLTRHPFINQKELCDLLPSVARPRITKCLTEMKFECEITQSKFGYSLAQR